MASPQPNPPSPAVVAEYSPEERRQLLALAHGAILAALEDKEIDLTPPSAHLAQPRGAFTTWHLHGQLRGCVGYVLAMHPLYRTVAETAVAAAFHDTRFYPVSAAEAPELEAEISVLSPLRPIRPEEIQIGRHGLVIGLGRQRGLLLPQVPGEYGWNVETFLEETCHKAGLPGDAWRKGAIIEGFTAEVFGDSRQ
jgi:AmmeMemoRadiSam system protein A